MEKLCMKVFLPTRCIERVNTVTMLPNGCALNLCKTENNPDLANKIIQIFTYIGECMPIEARWYVQQMDECSKTASHDEGT